MNKNIIIAILGAAVVALAVLHFWPKPKDVCKACGKEKAACVEGCTHDPCICTNTPPQPQGICDKCGKDKTLCAEGCTHDPCTCRSVVRRPLETEATRRLHDGPVVVSSLFEATGRADHSSYGKKVQGSYFYTTTVKARSEIVSKEENKTTGSVRVVEKRTFTQARDHLSLSELDVAIDLETLPVAQVKGWVDGIANVVGAIAIFWTEGAAAPVVAKAKAEIAAGFMALNATDGASARWLLGAFGVEIPKNLEGWLNERIAILAERKLHTVKMALQTIEGKTFIITYTQAANGMPLNVDFTHEGGEPISEAEWEILRSANAFLDANAVPDKRYTVGASWTIWADEAQELFGMAGDGRAEGKVRVKRIDDQQDGSWTLTMEPSTITFRNDAGTTSGSMEVKGGNGLVDAEKVSVKSLQATAKGSLRSLNKTRHAMFFDFVKKLNGDANLRFTLSVDPAE